MWQTYSVTFTLAPPRGENGEETRALLRLSAAEERIQLGHQYNSEC